MKFKTDERYNVTFSSCGKIVTRELVFKEKVETFANGIFVFEIPFKFKQKVQVVEVLPCKKDAEGKLIQADSMSQKGKLYTHFVPINRRMETRLISTLGIAGANIQHYELIK